MKGTFEKKEHLYVRGVHTRGFIGYPPMFHSHCELIYVVKGSLNTVIDGQEKKLCEGELALVFPYQTHSYENAPDTEVIIILFSPTAIAFDNTFINFRPICNYTDGKVFFKMLDRAVALMRGGKTKTAMGYLNAVIGETLENMELERVDSAKEDTAVKILEYCTEHFCEEISVRSVSEALYISQSYVSKIFAFKLKYGFREYINTLRVDKAKVLLQETDKKVVEIMLDCGFKNQSSFNRIFKQMAGESPYEYRQSKTI